MGSDNPELQRTWDPEVVWHPEVAHFLSGALGRQRLASISAALVRPPRTTCIRVNTTRTTPEAMLQRLPHALSPEDRLALDRAGRPPFIHPQLPMAVLVPGSGPHEVDYSRAGGREVVVGRQAGESMLRGANAYATGVLACSAGLAAGDLVAVSVAVERAATGKYGVTRGTVLEPGLPLDDARLPNRARLFIGMGRAELSRSGIFSAKCGVAVTMVDRVFRIPSLGDALKGDGILQNLPSLVAALVLSPTPGSLVLDMCAAPGGKCTAMAELMLDRGQIIALDRTHGKAVAVQQLAAGLGLACIKAFKADATRVVKDPAGYSARRRDGAPSAGVVGQSMGNSNAPRAEVAEGFPPESFDYVLLDAPCSGLGLRPRLVLPHTLRELRAAAEYQRKLLDSAVRLVRPGGSLVYSTCSINADENEANVRHVLDKHTCMRLVPQQPRFGGPGLMGSIPDGHGGRRALLGEAEAALVQRFDPSADLDTPGFFIAKFEKQDAE